MRFPRMPIQPAAGGGPNYPKAEKSIRLARHGCTNRPFYHIVVLMRRRHQHDQPIEQIGTYDPLPNDNNEKLVSINLERLQYWIAMKSHISTPVATLLGFMGYFPIHPRAYMHAWRNRMKAEEFLKTKEKVKEEVESSSQEAV